MNTSKKSLGLAEKIFLHKSLHLLSFTSRGGVLEDALGLEDKF